MQAEYNTNEFPSNINNGFIYGRISTKGQNNDMNGNLSLNSQVVMAKNFCDANHIIIKSVGNDIGSAYNNPGQNQKELSRMVRMMNFGDLLVVADISRLFRNLDFAMKIIGTIKKKESFIYSFTDKIWYNNPNRICDDEVFYQKILDSQKESNKISQRMKRSVEFRKNRGDKFGIAPWGKKPIRDDIGRRIFVNNDEEMAITKIAKDLVINKNYTFVNTANILNDDGYRNRKNKPFTANYVRNTILKMNSSLNYLNKKIGCFKI